MRSDEFFNELIEKICQYPRGSTQRRKHMNRLMQNIIQSGKLWRENTSYYEDALQQTWLYLCRNLCEADTAEEPYNPQKSSVFTWLNSYLRWRLRDFRNQEQQKSTPPADPRLDPLGNLPDPRDRNIPPMLEEIRYWIESDPQGELRNTHIRGRQDLTCQVLMLRRLPPETGWRELEAEYGCSMSTLANFYQRQCLPRLRKRGESMGYF
ncbi:MAG: sigma-70 family RNA polymerase sigma factor [Cyanobacteriota bacterium]|nr:sigma-70 family RNA polymerase sigma factor [Cyanobacteriota bacterium]